MKITNISAQIHNPDRVNVSVDGKYRLSLDISQVVELDIKNGQDIDAERLAELEEESQFGKLYARTLEYCVMRPRSQREIRDYLYRKTLTKKILIHKNTRSRSGLEQKEREILEKQGVSHGVAERVFVRLNERGYVDDEKFARYWLENRNQTKGASRRKLVNELRAKGVEGAIIEQVVAGSERNDQDEIKKMIAKKHRRYPDEQKMIAYLARQGFGYDDIVTALRGED